MLNYAHAVRRAIDRDIDDKERLDWLQSRVACWLDELIPEMHDLGHPCRRWSPLDLVECLREQLDNIKAEEANLTGPLWIDEDC